MRSDFFLVILLAAGSLLVCGDVPTTFAQESSEHPSANATAVDEQPPVLAVDTIYGPENRYDYDGPSPPPHRWITRDGTNLLAIKRESQWRLLDPASGDDQEWELPEQLAASISQLPQVDTEKADEVAERLLRSPETELERALVRIDKGYALVGAQTQPKWIARDAERWRNVTLSPTGTHVAYNVDNDLYCLEIATGSTRALTTDGSDTQLNGILDWSYQEEIYGRGNFKGFWWSPDGNKIAFLRLDIRNVYEYTVVDSATPRGSTRVVRYPKVGDPIPEAELWVSDLSGSLDAIHEVDAETKENLIVRVTWHPGGQHIAYQATDRLQSWLELRLAKVALRNAEEVASDKPNFGESDPDAVTVGDRADCRVLLRDSSHAWVEVLGEPIWLNDQDFLWLSDQPLGKRRLWRINQFGRERVAVTPEDFIVRSLGDLSDDQRTIFVEGDADRGTRGQQLYRATVPRRSPGRGDASDPPVERPLQRLTSGEGWHAVRVAPNQQWMVDAFSTVETPPMVSLVPIPSEDEASPTESSDQRIVLHEPVELPADWAQPQWIEITVADEIALPAYYLRPQNVEETVPVLIETYGGPMAPSAVDRWGGTQFLYRQFLVQQGIAVLVVDNRSSAGRGISDTWSIHRQMGVLELQDLLTSVDWLKSQSWVDGDHLGIRGWSFGGYLTAYALTHSDAFAAGIAGGSPTDWRNYDAIYTERYMGLPDENADGYERTSVLAAAEDLHGRLLLIHGELDDNVHLANTLQLTAALQKAGKQFGLMIYPGVAHGVHHPKQVNHLMTLTTQFLLRHLEP